MLFRAGSWKLEVGLRGDGVLTVGNKLVASLFPSFLFFFFGGLRHALGSLPIHPYLDVEKALCPDFPTFSSPSTIGHILSPP